MAYRLYVGNLPMDIREREIDDLFYKYGKIIDIDIKTQSRPPAFCFISYDDKRDADDAIRGRDGYTFDGNRLRVEYAKGSRGGGRDSGRDSGRDRDRDRDDGRQIRGPGRRSEWGVVLSKLPPSASWQDVKDFMRKAGDVIYADVDRQGGGVCEFSNEDDMHNAVRKLDDTEFSNRYDNSFVRVELAKKSRGGGRSRSRSRDRPSRRDRSRSGSGSKERSPSRSVSRSPSKDGRRRSPSRSVSHTRSRSPSQKAQETAA